MNVNQTGLNKDLLKNPKLPWWLSWPIIIISSLAFWPIGILLIWRRLSLDKKSAIVSGKLVSILGWIGIAFAALMILVMFSEEGSSDMMIAVVFFAAAGLTLIFFGRKIIKTAERFKKYISIVVNHNETMIVNIAAAIPTSFDTAKKELQKMIDKGYFAGAYINHGSGEIILPKLQNQEVSAPAQNISASVNTEMTVISCKGCGANNKIIKGSISECQYCSSPLGS